MDQIEYDIDGLYGTLIKYTWRQFLNRPVRGCRTHLLHVSERESIAHSAALILSQPSTQQHGAHNTNINTTERQLAKAGGSGSDVGSTSINSAASADTPIACAEPAAMLYPLHQQNTENCRRRSRSSQNSTPQQQQQHQRPTARRALSGAVNLAVCAGRQRGQHHSRRLSDGTCCGQGAGGDAGWWPHTHTGC